MNALAPKKDKAEKGTFEQGQFSKGTIVNDNSELQIFESKKEAIENKRV